MFGKLEVVEGSSVNTTGVQSLFVKGNWHATTNGIKYVEVLYVCGLTKTLISVGSMTGWLQSSL